MEGLVEEPHGGLVEGAHGGAGGGAHGGAGGGAPWRGWWRVMGKLVTCLINVWSRSASSAVAMGTYLSIRRQDGGLGGGRW